MNYSVRPLLFIASNNSEIDNVVLSKIISFDIQRDILKLENRANVVIDKSLIIKNSDKSIKPFYDFGAVKEIDAKQAIQVGSWVTIYCKYYVDSTDEIDDTILNDLFNDRKEILFEGFINNIILDAQETVTLEILDFSYIFSKIIIDIPQQKKTTLKTVMGHFVSTVQDYLNSNYSNINLTLKIAGQEEVLYNYLPIFDYFSLVDNFEMYNFKVTNLNGIDFLKILQNKFFLPSFLDENNLLQVGFRLDSKYWSSEVKNVKIFSINNIFEKNDTALGNTQRRSTGFTTSNDTNSKRTYHILDSSNLKYQFKNNINLGVDVKIINPRTGVKKEVKIGGNGESKTLLLYGDYNENDIKNNASQYLAKFKYSGFQQNSTFVTYGEPRIKINYPISLIGVGFESKFQTPYYLQNKSVAYLVSGLNTTMDSNGFRQNVQLSIELDIIRNNLPFSGPEKIPNTDVDINEGSTLIKIIDNVLVFNTFANEKLQNNDVDFDLDFQ